jgi:tRNA(Leu) C34 or U34 (ribose-2'-O)-methylase TrmL
MLLYYVYCYRIAKYKKKEDNTMEFIPIAENNRVRINLSETAYMIINDDMQQFNIKSRSTFINTVLHNYYKTSKASIDLYQDRKKEELYDIFYQYQQEKDSDSCEAFIKTFLQHEKEKQMKYISTLLKDKFNSQIYYINTSNYEALMQKNYNIEKSEYSCYKSFSQYLKCILEDYASLTYKEREQIFFQQQYDIANEAIKNHSLLEVTTASGDAYKVWPFSFDTDSLSTRLYLVGMSKSINDKTQKKHPASFRIPYLKKIKICSTRKNGEKIARNGKLTKEDQKQLKEAIAIRKVQFLIGQEEEIHIRLTDEGIEKYKALLHMRPDFDPQKSSDHEYVFHCTERQAEVYFFKFGKDAEVISPNSLREKFHEMYQKALSVYENNK